MSKTAVAAPSEKGFRIMDNRKEYLNQLLHAVRQLEEKVGTAGESGTLSFSFFNDSFEQMQQITSLLHRLQTMQIDDMKQQMERLLVILSERTEPETKELPEVETRVFAAKETKEIPEDETREIPEDETREIPEDETIEEKRQPERVQLPGYRNPRLHEPIPAEDPKPIQQSNAHEEIQGMPSLNDVMQAPPSLLDLKRGISLNDRFLFQRELFHNNREEMNGVMIRLNAFESYEKAEEYLREKMDWDFDAPVVQDFLRVIKKGFM